MCVKPGERLSLAAYSFFQLSFVLFFAKHKTGLCPLAAFVCGHGAKVRYEKRK